MLLKCVSAQVVSFLSFDQRLPGIVYHLPESELLQSVLNTCQYNELPEVRSMGFRKYRSEFLNDTTLAGKTLNVQVVKLVKHHNFFYRPLNDLHKLNQQIMDSVFAGEKVIETIQLRYDRQGRLKQRRSKQTEFKNMETRDKIVCKYRSRGGSSSISLKMEKYEDRKVAGYQSLYLDEQINGPTLSHSTWLFKLRFDKRDRLVQSDDHYVKFTNGKKDYKPYIRVKSYRWDSIDRVIWTRDSLNNEGRVKNTNYTYEESTLNINVHAEKYPILKSRSGLSKWLRLNFDSSSLSIVSLYALDTGVTSLKGVFIVKDRFEPVLYLGKSESEFKQMNAKVYDHWSDSLGTNYSVYDAMYYQYATHSARSAVDRTSYQVRPLEGKWTLLIRASTSLQGGYVFMDAKGRVRYYYYDQRLYRVGVEF